MTDIPEVDYSDFAARVEAVAEAAAHRDAARAEARSKLDAYLRANQAKRDELHSQLVALDARDEHGRRVYRQISDAAEARFSETVGDDEPF